MSTLSTAELARFSALVDVVYDGATNPERWSADIPAALTAYIGANMCVFFSPERMPYGDGFATTHGMPLKYVDLYTSHFHREDIQARAAYEKGLVFEGNVMLCSELVPRDQLLQSSYYREYLAPGGMAYSITAMIFGANSASRVTPVVCSIWRGGNGTPYSEDDRERLKLLVPHLSRSLGVMHRLREADLKAAVSLDALNKLSAGIVLIGHAGQAVFANRAAQRMLEAEDGLVLRHLAGQSTLGELAADDGNTHAAIKAAIMGAIDPDILATAHFGRVVQVARPSGRAPYTLNFSSLPPRNEFGIGNESPRAIAFITDSAAPITIDAGLLQSTYGLTPAEVRAAVALTEGCTVDEAAAQLGVSVNTVKTQLQQVYYKTGTGNRAKLVKLMLSLSPLGE